VNRNLGLGAQRVVHGQKIWAVVSHTIATGLCSNCLAKDHPEVLLGPARLLRQNGRVVSVRIRAVDVDHKGTGRSRHRDWVPSPCHSTKFLDASQRQGWGERPGRELRRLGVRRKGKRHEEVKFNVYGSASVCKQYCNEEF